jgi:hypothetical protein
VRSVVRQAWSARLALGVAVASAAVGSGNAREPAETSAPVVPLAAEVPMPDVRKGDAWEYEARGDDASSRRSIEGDSVEGAGRLRARTNGPAMPGAAAQTLRIVDYDGPWNVLQPEPAQDLTYLRFPLRPDSRWSSTAAGSGQMTRTLAQEVTGRQALTVAGSSIDCVCVDGIENTSTTAPPSVAASARTGIWYCPQLRGVACVASVIANAPVVTQTLLAFRPGTPAP